ncbi:MAG TPA: hypothetical protein VFE51_09310 [Verrucomicrobiae bacterium]|nr:hypothetical protein [Verrucomicrobiae bacterium]
MNREKTERSDRCVEIYPMLIAALVGLALVWASWLALSHSPEPRYGGRPVSQWLNAGQEDASMAMHEIGAPALPYILAKLAREDPECGSYREYRRWWSKVPTSIRCVLPKPAPALFDDTRAVMALLELGPEIIPSLALELRRGNPARRRASAEVLARWHKRGKNITVAIPALRLASRDPDPRLARVAEVALAPVPHE